MNKRKKKKIDEYIYLDPIDEARRARNFARRQRRADSLMSYLTDKTDEERIRDAQLAQQAVLAKGRHKSGDAEADAASAAAGPDAHAAAGPDAHAAAGSDAQAVTGPDAQAAIGPDVQAAGDDTPLMGQPDADPALRDDAYADGGTGNNAAYGVTGDSAAYGSTGDNAAYDVAGDASSNGVFLKDAAAGDAALGDASGGPAANLNESDIEDPFERILRSADLAAIPEEEWNDEDFWNHAEILKPKEEEYKIWKPWMLFLASIVCTALFCLVIYTSWQAAGDLPWYWGIAGMALTLASFAGMVFGLFDFRKMARHKQAQGILGFILFLIVFLLMAGLYVLGLGVL